MKRIFSILAVLVVISMLITFLRHANARADCGSAAARGTTADAAASPAANASRQPSLPRQPRRSLIRWVRRRMRGR